MKVRDVEATVDRAAAAKSELIAALEERGKPRAAPRTDSVLSDLKPVRPLPAAPILLFLCLIQPLVIIAAGTKLFGLAGWGAQSWLLRALLLGAGGTALVAASYGFSRLMVPGALRRFAALPVELIAAGVFIGTVAISFHHKYPIDMVAADEGCFKNGIILSAAAMGLTLLAARRGVWLDRFASSLQVAALSSAAALVVMTLYCPILTASHVFVAHLGAVAVVVLSAWCMVRISS